MLGELQAGTGARDQAREEHEIAIAQNPVFPFPFGVSSFGRLVFWSTFVIEIW